MVGLVPRLRNRWLLAISATVVTSILFLDFCNLMYACGCRSWWAGADAFCNIHRAGARHCPWCSIGLVGSSAVWLTIAGTQAWLALGSRAGWALRSSMTFAAFPIVGGLIAVAIGLAHGYWL